MYRASKQYEFCVDLDTMQARSYHYVFILTNFHGEDLEVTLQIWQTFNKDPLVYITQKVGDQGYMVY